MRELALAVGILIRTWSGIDPALVLTVSSDATSYRVDAASYALDARCSLLMNGVHKCIVPLLGAERDIRHVVTACKNSGTLCGGTKQEVDVSCYCPTPGPWDCPDLFRQTPYIPPVPQGLMARAVSDSQIDLSWQDACGAEFFLIERGPTDSGPWSEIARVP